MTTNRLRINSLDNNLSARIIVGLIAVALFALVGILASLMSGFGWTVKDIVLQILLVALLLAPIAWMLRAGKFEMFHPVNMWVLTFTVAFVISPLIMVSNRFILNTGTVFLEQISSVTYLVIVGLLGCYCGFFWVHRLRPPKLIGRVEALIGSDQTVSRARIFRYTTIALIITGLMFVLWFVLADIPLAYLNALDEDVSYTYSTTRGTNSVLYLYWFRRSWPLLILAMWHFKPKGILPQLIIIALWITNFSIFFVAANRSTLFMFIGATLLFYYARKGKRPSIFSLALFLGVIIISSSFLVFSRSRAGIVELDQGTVVGGLVDEITLRGAAAGIANVTATFTEQQEHIGVSMFSDLYTLAVPRVLWPDKPGGFAAHRALNEVLPRAHSPSLIGLYYIGFNVFGSFFICMLYSALSGIIYLVFKRNTSSPLNWLILSAWIPFLWVAIHRGPPVIFLTVTGYTFAPILMAWKAALLADARQARRHPIQEAPARIPNTSS